MSGFGRAAIALAVLSAIAPAAERAHVYIGAIGVNEVLLAWGTTEGRTRNTIGRASIPLGRATVVLDKTYTVADRNWIEVKGLKPDTEYAYEVRIEGRLIGNGMVRTWPERPRRLDFFVIGDYGNGSGSQREIGAAMEAEFRRLKQAGTQVRFVLTTGDNIYSDHFLGIPLPFGSGDADHHWENKFFQPFQAILREIPFYPSFGNHDGDDSESPGDAAVMLDNFFYPGNRPAPYYRFRFGQLVEFFALDTTTNNAKNPEEQVRWLEAALSASKTPWKIAYGHHPPFNAGPYHSAAYRQMLPFTQLFKKYQVAGYFCGHEHNFQVSSANTGMAPTLMFLTGGGGPVRRGDVSNRMRNENIAAWAPSLHFLHVRIDANQMQVMPLGPTPIRPVDAEGHPVPIPFVVKRP